MSREIKFREWDGRRMFATPGLSTFEEDDGALRVRDFSGKELPLMQFTGLHDKSGKEIYEGDVVISDEAGWKAQVVYKYNAFILWGLNKKSGGFSLEPNYEKCEVIGNIYENSELLK